jgi:hypothetical protein
MNERRVASARLAITSEGAAEITSTFSDGATVTEIARPMSLVSTLDSRRAERIERARAMAEEMVEDLEAETVPRPMFTLIKGGL